MTRTLLAVGFACLCLTTCLAQDTHRVRTDALVRKYVQDVREVVDSANKVDAELAKRGKKSANTEQARLVARNIGNTVAWKELPSRETRRQRTSISAIEQMLEMAKNHLARGQAELAAIEEAEYAEWAKAHPQEAQIEDMRRRMKAAEESAEAAKNEARKAAEEAEQAKLEARRRDAPPFAPMPPPPPQETRRSRINVVVEPTKEEPVRPPVRPGGGDRPDPPAGGGGRTTIRIGPQAKDAPERPRRPGDQERE